MRPDSVRFPGLDVLRALAAFAVFADHQEQVRLQAGLSGSFLGGYAIATHGVNLFFVLSGFLITFLLLVERQSYGRVDVVAFYARRALRIWPLYLTVVTLALFALPRWPILYSGWALPESGPAARNLLYFLFLPNFAEALFPLVALVSQAWSIGVEEQFYLVWPWVMRATPRPILLCVATILVRPMAWYAFAGKGEEIRHLLAMSRFDALAIGALAAMALHHGGAVRAAVTGRAAQIGACALVAMLMGLRLWDGPVVGVGYGVAFAILVLNVSAHGLFTARGWAPLRALGRVSYGFYMWHVLGIALSLAAFETFGWVPGALGIAALALVLTILLSVASYRFLEQPFLKAKARFTVVPSGS